MKFTTSLIAALIATAAAAPYTPPADQEDGVYHVTFDEAGQPLTRRLITSEATGAEVHKLQAREEPFPGQDLVCTDRDIPNDGSYQNVQNCLGNWLNQNSGNLNGNDVYYCRSGNTLLALCNYAGTVYGSSSEIGRFNGLMDASCGAYRSGYIFIKDWNKTYWRTTWGESICDNLGGARQQVGK